MITAIGQTLYKNDLVGQGMGRTLHPGGLELTDRLLTLSDLPVNAHILDLGCGSGSTMAHLRKAGFINIYGFDQSKSLLHAGHNLDPNLQLTYARIQSLPVPYSRMDAVLVECCLSTLSDIQNALSEFWRVLRPGGCLALSDVYIRDTEAASPFGSFALNSGLHGAITKSELFSYLQKSGFEISVWEDHSDSLKYFAAQMILSYGSMCEFWSRFEPAMNPADILGAVKKAKPGYYLLVAHKSENNPKVPIERQSYI